MVENTGLRCFLGATAHWTASARALESERADRLLNDPWARALAGEVGAGWMAETPHNWYITAQKG